MYVPFHATHMHADTHTHTHALSLSLTLSLSLSLSSFSFSLTLPPPIKTAVEKKSNSLTINSLIWPYKGPSYNKFDISVLSTRRHTTVIDCMFTSCLVCSLTIFGNSDFSPSMISFKFDINRKDCLAWAFISTVSWLLPWLPSGTLRERERESRSGQQCRDLVTPSPPPLHYELAIVLHHHKTKCRSEGLVALHSWSFCNQTWFALLYTADPLATRLGLLLLYTADPLASRLGLLLLYTADPFATKLGLPVHRHKQEYVVRKLDCCAQGQGHSEGSKCKLVFVWPISSEPLNFLWPNLVCWCIIISWSVVWKDLCANFKVKVTARAHMIQIRLFPL